MKTIYETLGQSIKVPHYGSKTIKVKLTVSPEKKACKSSEETTSSPTLTKSREGPGYHPGGTCNRWSNDLNYLKSREQRRYRQQEQKFRRRHSISSSGLSEDREADVSDDDDDDEVPLNNKYVLTRSFDFGLLRAGTSYPEIILNFGWDEKKFVGSR